MPEPEYRDTWTLKKARSFSADPYKGMDLERAALLRNVRDNPGDMTARLVYADWLDENGVDQWHARAIRNPGQIPKEDLRQFKNSLDLGAANQRVTVTDGFCDDFELASWVLAGFYEEILASPVTVLRRVKLFSGSVYVIFQPDYLNREFVFILSVSHTPEYDEPLLERRYSERSFRASVYDARLGWVEDLVKTFFGKLGTLFPQHPVGIDAGYDVNRGLYQTLANYMMPRSWEKMGATGGAG